MQNHLNSAGDNWQTTCYSLSTEQEFQLIKIRRDLDRLISAGVTAGELEQIAELFLQQSRLLMVKDNLLRHFMRNH